MNKWTEGVCGDGVVFLRDGVMISISKVLSILNDFERGVRPRSSQDHRRLFKLIAAAFDHWPESYVEFQPDSEEHLRAWLICKAGPEFRNVTTFDLPHTDNVALAAEMIDFAEKLLSSSNGFGRWRGMTLHKFTPKSMRFDKMSRTEFNDLRDAISDVIEDVCGMSADTLLKETESAA